MSCQPGDCIWSLQFSSEVCVGIYGITYSLYHPEGEQWTRTSYSVVFIVSKLWTRAKSVNTKSIQANIQRNNNNVYIIPFLFCLLDSVPEFGHDFRFQRLQAIIYVMQCVLYIPYVCDLLFLRIWVLTPGLGKDIQHHIYTLSTHTRSQWSGLSAWWLQMAT